MAQSWHTKAELVTNVAQQFRFAGARGGFPLPRDHRWTPEMILAAKLTARGENSKGRSICPL